MNVCLSTSIVFAGRSYLMLQGVLELYFFFFFTYLQVSIEESGEVVMYVQGRRVVGILHT